MSRFQGLSNELVLGILEEVFPDDIESISLASKKIYRLATPRLEEHHRLRKQYTNFENMVERKPNNWHDPGGLFADLLCKIMTDTRVGHYVKKIDLDLWNIGPKDGWKPDAVFEKQASASRTRLQHDSRTYMEIIEEAVRSNEIIPPEEVDDWLQKIRSGNEDPLVALLLLHAPKLETLKFINPYRQLDSLCLLKMVQRIVAQDSTVELCLSHLKNVEIYFAEGWESLDFLKAFMSLPSLTSFRTKSLFVDGRTHEANSAILPQISNVTDLSFRSGLLPGMVFSELLRGVKNLKSFAYDFCHLWRDEDYTPSFECFPLLNSLEANAGQTLERLKLGAEKIETTDIAPARAFRALRDIEIQTSRCFAVDEDKPANFAGFLPVSLERFAMHWYKPTSTATVETLIKAVLGFIGESKAQLPHLRMLHLSTASQEESDALSECLASDETAQINPLLSFHIRGPCGDGQEIAAWADNICTCGQDCFGNGRNEPI